MVIVKTKSAKETKEVAESFLWDVKKKPGKRPLILALEGNLGSGKTVFTQGLARALGIKEKVVSPTFVLLKIYQLPPSAGFKHLIHIDCYRLDSPQDLLHLGFKNLLKDKDAILVIEWADRVRKLLPRNVIWIKFKYGIKPNKRVLNF